MLISTRQLVNRLLTGFEESSMDLTAIRNALRSGKLQRNDLREIAVKLLANEGRYSAQIQSGIIELFLDALRSEAIYPDYLFSEEAVSLPKKPIIAILFQVFPHIANELYPLFVDGFTASLSTGDSSSFQVLGIHADWLEGDSGFRRAIFFHEETAALIEADIIADPKISAAHIFALDLSDEAECHRQIAAQLTGVRMLNPADGAALLDDKVFTGNCWANAGLITPHFTLLSTNDSLEKWELLYAEFLCKNGAKLLIKPRWGTEGRGVKLISSDMHDRRQELANAYAKGEDYLLMPVLGNLYCNIAQSARSIAFRYNVSWIMEEAVAESAYLQLAGSEQLISSVGQGGAIVSLAEYQQYFCNIELVKWQATDDDWLRIKHTAELAVATLARQLGNEMPTLIGIDMLAEIADDNTLIPILLEANGRPAGMGHCKFLTSNRPGNEPGVTQRLFSFR